MGDDTGPVIPMHQPFVRHIRGLNLRVQDLDQAVAFYRTTLDLRVRRALDKEVFLRWATEGEDFIGLFMSRDSGWHHMELRLIALDVQMAFRDLASKSLIPQLRAVGSSEADLGMLYRWVAPPVETFTPLIDTPLVAELTDPDGRVLELVYLKEDYADLELPGLLAIEVETPKPDVLAKFYLCLGFRHTSGGLATVSGQKLLIRKGTRPEWVRITLSVGSQAYAALTKFSKTAGGLNLRDPDGHELIILPEGGVTV